MSLKKNISIYTIGNILPQAASFLLLPLYTRFMSPEDYGIVNSMSVLQTVLIILFTFSTERSIYRLYYDYNNEKEKQVFIGTITITIFATSVFVSMLLFVLNDRITGVYSSIPFFPWYAIMILTAFCGVFGNIPKIHLQVKEKAGQFVAISIIQFFINNVFILYFVVYLEKGAVGMMYAYLLSAVILLPYFLFYTYGISKLSFDFNVLKHSLKFSLPLIPVMISAWVLNYTDRIFIEKYFSLSEVGIYSLGNKIGSLVLVFSAAFYKAYNPFFYRMANSEDQVNAKSTLYRTNMVFSLVTMLFCFSIVFFSREVIDILFDDRYNDTYKVVPWIVLGYLLSQLNGLTNLFFYQEKQTRSVMNIILIGAVISLAANFIFIPLYGPIGAGISFIVSNLFMLLTQYFLARRFYFIPFNWLMLVGYFVPLCCLVFVFDYLLAGYDPFLMLTFKLLIFLVILFYAYRQNKAVVLKVIE